MNHDHTSVRRVALGLAIAAFGVASLGVTSVARADHDYDDYDQYQVGPYGQYRGDHEVNDDYYVDLDRYAPAEDFDRHARVDFRYYDRNRNGHLETWEREAYWRHLADMGVFGRRELIGSVAALAKALDRDGDGRMTRREVQLVRRFIAARKMFESQDRDNDNRLYRGETYGWLRNHFYELDRDRDRRVTRVEIKQHFVSQDYDRPRVWSWNWYRR